VHSQVRAGFGMPGLYDGTILVVHVLGGIQHGTDVAAHAGYCARDDTGQGWSSAQPCGRLRYHWREAI
jgi:hypothetical protein